MTARLHLLPSNSTPLERAVSEAADRTPELGAGVDALHAFKVRRPINESVLPWLVVEYGLGPVTPYLPDLATVIDYGVRWSRLKGTPQGIREALSWIGYAFDTFYEAPTRRTRWHLFELELDRFRDSEADLDRIEAVARLSEPARSPLWRGWREYNIRGFEWGESRWGDTLWGDSSGVRLHDGGVKWSFGRTHEPAGGSYDVTYAELTDLGIWMMPAGSGGGLGWGNFAWSTPGLTWNSGGNDAWNTVLSTGLLGKSCWIELRRADGSVIGSRRARAWHAVAPDFAGIYTVGDTRYQLAGATASRLYVEAMTDFGQGDGEQAASWGLVLGATLPAGSKPGAMWLAGDALVGGVAVGTFAMSALLGKTARERCRAIIRLDAGTVFRDEPAAQLLGAGDGAAIDLLALQAFVRDGSTPPNNYIGDPAELMDFQRATAATYFDADGVLQTAGVDELRYDHDPATNAGIGLMVEGAATNRVTNSEFPNGISDAPVRSGLLSGSTFTGLFGNTAIAFGHDGATDSYAYKTHAYAPSTIYTLSVFVRMDDGQAPTFGSGTNTSASNSFVLVLASFAKSPFTYDVTNMGDGLYRVSVTAETIATVPSGNTGVVKYAANGGGRTFKVSGYQLELGGGATSYIPTQSAPVARGPEAITLPLASFPWNDGDGVLTINGMAVAPILTGGNDALDITAVCIAASVSHLQSLKWLPN